MKSIREYGFFVAVVCAIIFGAWKIGERAEKQVGAQTVTNGQLVLPYASTMTFDTSYISNSMTMTGNVTSFAVPNGGYGGQVFHLSVCQGTGGPWAFTGANPSNVTGQTGPLNATGCTYFRMVWDVPSTKWITSIIGQSPAGFVAEYASTGVPLPSYACTLLQGTSTTGGTFSMSFTANPLWTTPSSVFVRTIAIQSGAAGTPATSYTAYWTTVSTTSVTGFVKSGTTLGVLGATIVAGTVAEPLTVEVCGW